MQKLKKPLRSGNSSGGKTIYVYVYYSTDRRI
nr:MAG TPA: hypothetical protein [Caudoviricetes sp.]